MLIKVTQQSPAPLWTRRPFHATPGQYSGRPENQKLEERELVLLQQGHPSQISQTARSPLGVDGDPGAAEDKNEGKLGRVIAELEPVLVLQVEKAGGLLICLPNKQPADKGQ